MKKSRNDSDVLRKSFIPSLRSGSRQALHSSALSTQHSALVPLAYAGLIGIGEVTALVAGAYYATWFHALLVPALLNHYMLATGAPYRRILPVLALLPLLRILSLVMPVRQLPELYWYLLVGAPLLFAALITTRLLRLSAAALGLRLRLRMWPMQVAIGMTGLPLGLAGFLLLLPQPIIATFNLREVAIGVVILFVFTGFTEEFIFRGLLQTVAGETLRRGAIYISTALFTTMYLGTFSPRYILFTCLVGLYFGWCADRTGSIWGVIVAHGLLNTGMLIFWPFTNREPNYDLIARLSAGTQLALWLLGVIVIGLLLRQLLVVSRELLVPQHTHNSQLTTHNSQLRGPYDTRPLEQISSMESAGPPRNNWIPLVALLVLWQLLGLGLCALGLSRGESYPLSPARQPATGPTPSPTRSVTPPPLPSPTPNSQGSLFHAFPAPEDAPMGGSADSPFQSWPLRSTRDLH